MATLTVGANQQYSSIAAAVAAAKDGDTVSVAWGTYVNDFATVRSKISLVATGGTVTLLDTATMASGQGILTVAADATVTGFVIEGAHAADGTAAGIVYQGGALTLSGSLVSGNQSGLVAGASSTGTIAIKGSEFAGNGNGTSSGSNIAVGAISSLTISGSYVHDAMGGDEIRSLALTNTVTGNRIEDSAGAALIGVDLPNGGTAVVQNNTIEKGAGSGSTVAVQFGGGTLARFSTLNLSNNVFVADRAGGVVLRNQSTQAATYSGDQAYGFATVVSGLAVNSGSTVLTARPTVSTAALVVPSGVPFVEYGRAGAVVASGRVLTVGAGGTYATLGAAVAASRDGDTINVAAGNYLNDTVVVSHKLIIQGVGGMARFVDTVAPANGAQFLTTTDVTFRNVEVFGVATPGGASAAIHAMGGNLTVVNSTIHDNQAGIVVDRASGGTAGIYDSELSGNGTADGRGGNLQVGEVGTLTLRNDYVHDGVAGSEIVSAADNTELDGVRVAQAAGNVAAPVALPDGGIVSISGSALQKGASAVKAGTSAAVVSIGGGAIYGGSSVALSGDTLISQATGGTTVFVANPGAVPGVSVAATTFIGGAAGSVQVTNGGDTGAVVGVAGTVNTVSPWGATGAPAPAPLLTPAVPTGPAERGLLVLRVSETAWHGDAQFALTVDGAAVGGTLTATALHAAGQSQNFTIAGPYAPGPHVVAVKLLNSLMGTDSSGSGARTLTVDGMSFNGEDTGQAAALTANGTALLSTAPTLRATPVTVNLSETAWNGDALAFVTIDGKVQGGVQTVTANHGQASQAMSFVLNLTPGPHTASVTMLNGSGAGGTRALYVDSMDVAGQHYAAAAATLASGSSAFAFNVGPAAAANGSLFITAGLPQPLASLIPTS